MQALDGDPRHGQVLGLVEALVEELRRRVGSSFTLSELADSYPGSDKWAYEAIERRDTPAGWTRWLTTALDSAFHLYARGARDDAP